MEASNPNHRMIPGQELNIPRSLVKVRVSCRQDRGTCLISCAILPFRSSHKNTM